jgi:hypothetical protein
MLQKLSDNLFSKSIKLYCISYKGNIPARKFKKTKTAPRRNPEAGLQLYENEAGMSILF